MVKVTLAHVAARVYFDLALKLLLKSMHFLETCPLILLGFICSNLVVGASHVGKDLVVALSIA